MAPSIFALLFVFLLLGLVPWAAAGQAPPTPETPTAVEMPDESHRALAEYAA
jgi:hypothetical protein